jgi:hypothetical protein
MGKISNDGISPDGRAVDISGYGFTTGTGFSEKGGYFTDSINATVETSKGVTGYGASILGFGLTTEVTAQFRSGQVIDERTVEITVFGVSYSIKSDESIGIIKALFAIEVAGYPMAAVSA